MTLAAHPGFSLAPLADGTGPFSTEGFLSVVSRYDEGDPMPASSADAFIPLRRVGETVLFAGEADVTDYHTPRGHGVESLIADVVAAAPAARFELDSLPEEAARPLVAGLEGAGLEVTTRVHEVTAVVRLPETVDDYMSAIGKKERHEIRRKRRRFESMVGPIRHEIHSGPGWALQEYLRLHRLAAGHKGTFMTGERAAFFTELASLEGWRFDLLRTGDEEAVAAVFGYVDRSGYYLYNSGYDPAAADASPGVVLLSIMIERAIAEGVPRFDFLKGNEAYKFRLGAEPRPLTGIVATPGDTR